MESYESKFREPVKTTYRGYEVAAFAPPSGGCALVEMLNILENYDVRSMGHNTAASIHALTESMKLGFADRSVALGDPDFVNVDVERLTSKNLLMSVLHWREKRRESLHRPMESKQNSILEIHPISW